MELDNSFWKDKKVLVTGHTGFKGSWASMWLKKMGAQVVGVSLDPPTNPSLYEEAQVAEGMTSIRCDICDLDKIKKIFQESKPKIVIHMAAQSLVQESYIDPVNTYNTNVMGTLNILEAIRGIESVRSAIMVTTDKCYENREWHWGYRESDRMGGYDPYSSSKGCAELLISSYRNSFFNIADYENHRTAIASVRAGNVIGGGDWAKNRLIPDILKSINSKNDIEIRFPHSIRPWQHVLEPVHGYLLLAERLYTEGPKYAEAWNFGPNDEDAKPVSEIVDMMLEYSSPGVAWFTTNKEQKHEAGYLKLDCSKVKNVLGWKPRWNISETIKAIIEWNEEFIKGKPVNEICDMQISNYLRSK
ncbi:CDP-glucose 4,6-dehydratase [Acetoanaerobium sticklandii]|uniref:CDP-glucose 4,6-dehydratase n=1 Tax=Acetoanaerobium sticklandii TaxID=1511 RepID=UPI003A8D1F2F